MKWPILFLGTALLLTMTACESNSSKNGVDSVVVNPQESKVPPQEKFEMPTVKYLTAIVIEGGEGKKSVFSEEVPHIPMWRLYICLKESESKTNGKVVLDFDKIGENLEVARFNNNDEVVSLKKYKKITIDYMYDAKLTKYNNETTQNVAWGSADFKSTMKAETVWDASYGERPSYERDEWDIFAPSTTHGDLGGASSTTYKRLDGKEYYIHTSGKRFLYSEKNRSANLIKACEENDSSYVLQVGSEITED